MRVGIIGMGHVGTAVAACFTPQHELVTWDAADATPYPVDELAACDYAVVCVPTPPLESGHADTSAVEQAVGALPTDKVLLRSTVPPSTTDRVAATTGKQVCFWPEYIGEGSYHDPYFGSRVEEVPFVILGGEPELTRWFVDVLIERLGPAKTYFQCSAIEAELAKYAENAYLATKVTFVNEFRRIAEAFGADWHTVREAWLLDPRIERAHSAAFADAPGFSGKCLPKDLLAIVAAALDAGYSPDLLRQVLAANDAMRADTADVTPAARPQRGIR